MKIKKYIKVIMMIFVMMLIPISGKANPVIIRSSIPFDNVKHEFPLEENTISRHVMELHEAGYMSMDTSVYNGPVSAYVRLYDEDMVLIYEHLFEVHNQSGTYTTMYEDLPPGIYYLQLESVNGAGSYSVRAEFTPAENHEIEPNNTKNQAMKLENGKTVVGFVTDELCVEGGPVSKKTDLIDYFYFETEVNQRIKIMMRSDHGGITAKLYNSDMKVVREVQANNSYYEWDMHLKAGKYYFSMAGWYEGGPYSLVMVKGAESPEVGKSYTKGGIIYKITSIEDDILTASVKKIKNTKAATAYIPGSIWIGTAEVRVTDIAKGAFAGCKKLRTVEIGNSVRKIGKEAFSGCTSLHTVIGAMYVENIGDKAFYNCSSLKRMEISMFDVDRVRLYEVKQIGKQAFYGCKSMESVYIPSKNLVSIRPSAFAGCNKMTSISIASKKLNTIGINAFNGCSELKKVTIKSKKLKVVGKYAFRDVNAKCVIRVPVKKLEVYRKFFTEKRMGIKLQVKKI